MIGALVLLASVFYFAGMASTISVMYDRDVCLGLIIFFAIAPIFNIIYPLVYGTNLKDELRKAFKK